MTLVMIMNLKPKMTKKWLLLLLIIPLTVFCFGYYQRVKQAQATQELVSQNINLPEMSLTELAQFDGSDSSKPIYIGMNGLVYDVSAGRDYYKIDGTYHFLAGKDSSDQLNIIGGDIIKRKYPVIAKLKTS